MLQVGGPMLWAPKHFMQSESPSWVFLIYGIGFPDHFLILGVTDKNPHGRPGCLFCSRPIRQTHAEKAIYNR